MEFEKCTIMSGFRRSGHIWTSAIVSKSTTKDVISSQKQPGCKKGAALFKMASVKKVVKSKGAAKKWL